MHGQGEFNWPWPDERRYVGGYVRDKFEGRGIYVFPDGLKYEG